VEEFVPWFAAACCDGSEGRGEFGDRESQREGDEAISLSFCRRRVRLGLHRRGVAWRGGSGSLMPGAHATIVFSLLCIAARGPSFPNNKPTESAAPFTIFFPSLRWAQIANPDRATPHLRPDLPGLWSGPVVTEHGGGADGEGVTGQWWRRRRVKGGGCRGAAAVIINGRRRSGGG
jgi:hypothetical protein